MASDPAGGGPPAGPTGGSGHGGQDGAWPERGRPFPPTDPGCELCRADRFTHWYAVTPDGWVADCEVCSVPMVVWWDHGPDCGPEPRERLLAALGEAADERFGPGKWHYDTTMRQVPEHFHAHARDDRWFAERFARPMSRYTGVGGDRVTMPLPGPRPGDPT